MALANTLSSNEVKNSAGTGLSFTRLGTSGRTTEFAYTSEPPNLIHRLKVSHQEIGSGVTLRRRSMIRIDKNVAGVSLVPRTVSAYIVLDTPVGDISANTEPTHVIAELLSFCASLGASTTILYDGTGSGAVALLSGGL